MALDNKTITEIAGDILADIETETGQAVPLLAKAVFRIMSWAFAGVWVILYKFASDAFLQRFPQTAKAKFLVYLGELVGMFRLPAVTWQGEAEIEATGAAGNIEADTQFVNSDSGKVYRVVNPVPIAPGTLTIELEALEAGEDSTLVVGDELDIVSPIPGVAMTCEITAVTADGENVEDLEVYRRRVVERYRLRPRGGSIADYIAWGKEAPNVVNIFVQAGSEPQNVRVFVEVDNQTDGIPTQAQLDLVEDYLTYDPITGEANRKPVGTLLSVEPITVTAWFIEIQTLDPDTMECRQAIESALELMVENKIPFFTGISTEKNNQLILVEFFAVAYSAASVFEASFANLILTPVLGAPYTLGVSERPKLRAVNFT